MGGNAGSSADSDCGNGTGAASPVVIGDTRGKWECALAWLLSAKANGGSEPFGASPTVQAVTAAAVEDLEAEVEPATLGWGAAAAAAAAAAACFLAIAKCSHALRRSPACKAGTVAAAAAAVPAPSALAPLPLRLLRCNGAAGNLPSPASSAEC